MAHFQNILDVSHNYILNIDFIFWSRHILNFKKHQESVVYIIDIDDFEAALLELCLQLKIVYARREWVNAVCAYRPNKDSVCWYSKTITAFNSQECLQFKPVLAPSAPALSRIIARIMQLHQRSCDESQAIFIKYHPWRSHQTFLIPAIFIIETWHFLCIKSNLQSSSYIRGITKWLVRRIFLGKKILELQGAQWVDHFSDGPVEQVFRNGYKPIDIRCGVWLWCLMHLNKKNYMFGI